MCSNAHGIFLYCMYMKNIPAIYIVLIFFISCTNAQKTVSEKNNIQNNKEDTLNTGKEMELPFVGKRGFETRPGVSGTGTPHKFVEIMGNRDVYFSLNRKIKLMEP